MAVSGFFALFDDIASLLDDVATMTKVATKKTAGVLGDDLALNAQQVAGVSANRELPVVFAVAVGSLKNKAILVPAALVISAFANFLITPLLMIGGAFLCFEGVEKLFHSKQKDTAHLDEVRTAVEDEKCDILAFEKEKIKGAIRTDFILSAEIIVISLGTVAQASFMHQLSVLILIALVMTIGVYGIVAAIVKMDDFGIYLKAKYSEIWLRMLGDALLYSAPKILQFLSFAGTIAMFMVGGGILAHGIPQAHYITDPIMAWLSNTPYVGSILKSLFEIVFEPILGFVLGGVVLGFVHLLQFLKKFIPSTK